MAASACSDMTNVPKVEWDSVTETLRLPPISANSEAVSCFDRPAEPSSIMAAVRSAIQVSVPSSILPARTDTMMSTVGVMPQGMKVAVSPFSSMTE